MEKDKKIPKVLVGSVLTIEDDGRWGQNLDNLYKGLSYPNKEFAKLVSVEEKTNDTKYERHSRARNTFIDKFLKPEHDYLFFIDPDLVLVPSDIIEVLLDIDSKNIIGAITLIEPNEYWPFERCFDISFTLDENGKNYNYKFPYMDTKKVNRKYAARSVGTCVMIPTEIIKKGTRFNPEDPRGDWISFCEAAINLGYTVSTEDERYVEHAFLPKYGINFH